MSKIIPIMRIGMCDCTCMRKFFGSLSGRSIILPERPGRTKKPSLELQLYEYPISAVNHDNDLIRYRCHFFWDMHMSLATETLEMPYYNTYLDLMWLVPQDTGEVLYSGREGRGYRRWDKWWVRASLPTTEMITEGMTEILHKKMGYRTLRRWLRAMTPSDWTCPAIAA